jgi:adenosine/AMP kinase
VINDIRKVNEVAAIHCATGNPIQVIVAKTELGRSIIGVVDGLPSKGIEGSEDKEARRKLLRDLGYKR